MSQALSVPGSSQRRLPSRPERVFFEDDYRSANSCKFIGSKVARLVAHRCVDSPIHSSTFTTVIEACLNGKKKTEKVQSEKVHFRGLTFNRSSTMFLLMRTFAFL